MARLVLAVLIALVLHALLLAMRVPEQRVVQPDIKGAGKVTVSIHRAAALQDENAPEETDGPDAQKEETMPEQESDLQEAVIDDPPPWEEPAQVLAAVQESGEKPGKAAADLPAPKQVVQTETREDEPAGETTEKKIAHTLSDKSPQGGAEVETLRDPVPVEHLNRPPAYPALARKRGWEGTVLLEVDILTDGMVQNISIKESSSYDLLDREALKAVRQWRFQPGTRAGVPVEMKVLVPVHFLLQEQ